jgi:hypothetical protein
VLFVENAVESNWGSFLIELAIAVGGGQLLADSNPLSCMFCCAGEMAAADVPLFDKMYNYILQN